MDFLRIFGWGVFIGAVMMIFQIMNISGQLDVQEFHLFDESVTAPLNMVPINDAIKDFLRTPEKIYEFLASFEPTKSQLYVGIEGITGTTEKSFLRFLLYLSTFFYYFLLTSIFAKISTIFSIEKDQKIFFSFAMILYLVITKILGNL